MKRLTKEELEKQIGCLLEARLCLTTGGYVWGDNKLYRILEILESCFWAVEIGENGLTLNTHVFKYQDYKKTWWLEEDKSE